MSIEKKLWGNHNGKDCYLFTLENGNMTAEITNYAGSLVKLIVPDKDGNKGDILLGYDTLDGYIAGTSSQGALVGRYANRIGGAKFTLNGKEYTLAKNDNGNTLHGGNVGFNKKVWNVKDYGENDNPYVVFSYTSVDGEEGFPGTLTLDVKYTLTADSIEICYNAVSDKDTVMNFTNHSYFNLNGTDAGNIKDHIAQKRIGEDMDNGKLPGGYDHNYVLGETKEMRKAAEIYSDKTGRVITTYTDMPAIQFYISGGLGGETGKGGKEMFKNQGFCLESQFCPDSPNKPQFKPTCVYKAGEQYNFTTIYKFSVK